MSRSRVIIDRGADSTLKSCSTCGSANVCRARLYPVRDSKVYTKIFTPHHIIEIIFNKRQECVRPDGPGDLKSFSAPPADALVFGACKW